LLGPRVQPVWNKIRHNNARESINFIIRGKLRLLRAGRNEVRSDVRGRLLLMICHQPKAPAN
jgi:hypothetical protein